MAIYLIKINVALVLLYGFYRLTVSRDTFFGLRRLTLWLIYAVALMVPALNLGAHFKKCHQNRGVLQNAYSLKLKSIRRAFLYEKLHL
ncbi:hypothetical protein JQM97_02790 [Prevotella hominis]|uniref:hypothetical protein n=1 Tax=Segatella hominis TaxID=2518605 RepID=UPI001F27817F|nr:hypothetical protein [Segatella hominis]MCF2589891.1 hypothetical protein [Segatella hominis]